MPSDKINKLKLFKRSFLIKSSHIFIESAIILISFHILSFDEPFNSLLDHQRIWIKLGTKNLGALSDERNVIDSSSGLHYFDNRCLNHVLSIVLYLILKLYSLSILLSLGVNHWYLNLKEIICVQEIDLELIVHLEVLAHWILQQNLKLTKWNQM